MSILIMGNPGYPAWRHNRAGESKVVNSKAEDKKLGNAWADSPAAFDGPEPAAEPDPSEPVTEPADD